MQALKCVGLRVSNSSVATALALARMQDIPNSNPMHKHDLQTLAIRQRCKRFADQITHQLPELIARMRVILAGRERSFRWKAAKYQAVGVAIDDWSKALQQSIRYLRTLHSTTLHSTV